ncbi:MAG: hypothetical protein AB7I79_00735 [Rhizobiaceae bacterium]
MSEASEHLGDNVRRLSDAIREARNAAADREDVVVDMREAQRMRLELLATELKPVFDEVPSDIDLFDFALSSGAQPRLWLDATAHVTMGRDRRTYRFLRDSRVGRVVLAESTDVKPVADQVTRYIADRIVERQRAVEGAVMSATGATADVPELRSAYAPTDPWRTALNGLFLLAVGAGAGLLIAYALLYDRLAAIGLAF